MNKTCLIYLSLRAIHHWDVLQASIVVLDVKQACVDRSRVGQDLFDETRHASAFDSSYASFRKSQGYDCDVGTCVWVSVVGILEIDRRSAACTKPLTMFGSKLTISEVVQFDFAASSCCVQSRESADGHSANDYNLLGRHFLEKA